MKSNKTSLIIHPGLTIKSALERMGKTGEKCLVVADAELQLKGTISDGDVRRAILDGIALTDSVDEIINTSPTVIKGEVPKLETLKEIFTKDRLPMVPVIDERSILLDILIWVDAFDSGPLITSKKLDVPVVIMAGGQGTRLTPFTKILPKPLIPINEKPVIEHIVDRLVAAGADEFFVTVKYKSRILKAFFEELAPSYLIEFFEEVEPLGTIGGLRLIKEKISSPFLVTNCDVIVDLDYAECVEFHKNRNNAITLVASAKDYTVPYGVCHLDDNGYLDRIEEKPKLHFLVNVGLYILSPEVIELIPPNQSYDITDLVARAKNSGYNVGVYPVGDSTWSDVGHWKEYENTVEKFRKINNPED
jgi:dTDP-glucose pyrophosphorylase